MALYDPEGRDDEYGYVILRNPHSGKKGVQWTTNTHDFKYDDKTGIGDTTIINLPDEAIEEIFNFVQKWRK